MRPRRDPVPRAKEAWWWLGGLLTLGLVGGGIVAAGITLWENIDVRRLAPALAEVVVTPTAAEPSPAAAPGLGFSSVILGTEANRGHFDDPGYYDAELTRWRELVGAAGGTVRDARSAGDLATLALADLLVLPEAPCLSSRELAVVTNHLRRGGSVVANWAFGARDGSCAWRGWGPLLSLTGAEDVRELPPRDGLYLTVPGGLALSPGFDPGTRVELRSDPALALRSPGGRVYWSDWALNPAPDGEGAGADVAVTTRRTTGGGRVAWFSFRTRQGATPADSARLDRLMTNGIRWAAGVPMAGTGAWPAAARAAMTFVLDVEGEESYLNARDAAAAFRANGVPISFFVVSQLVGGDRALAGELASAGEIGTQTVDHAPLGGRTGQDQGVRLRRSHDEVEAWSGRSPAGLRPPEESFDSVTVSVWSELGGRYIVATNDARSASPEIFPRTTGPVVLIPRLIKDDYDIVVRDITMRAPGLEEAWRSGARKVRAIGGVAVVAGHTQILSSGPRLDAMLAIADSARAREGWWMAGAGEIADWWAARTALRLEWVEAVRPRSASRSSLDRFDLIVTGGDTAVDRVWIDVVLPEQASGRIPTVDGVSVDYLEEPWGVRVQVGSIGAGQVRRISFVEA